jgi:excisionase family DNA binding protein
MRRQENGVGVVKVFTNYRNRPGSRERGYSVRYGLMNTPMLKIPEVAARLNVSDSFVYVIIAEGRLKHHRLGKGQGGIRISEQQLEEYLRTTEQGGEVPTRAKRAFDRPRYKHLT